MKQLKITWIQIAALFLLGGSWGFQLQAQVPGTPFIFAPEFTITQVASVATNNAGLTESVEIGSDTYIFFPNAYNGSSYNINSKLYKWNGSGLTFVQNIATSGASDGEFFTIGTDTYLAVANSYTGTTANTYSKIYKWNGTQFSVVQNIYTYGAFTWEFFTIGSDNYLALANHKNSGGGYNNATSRIYKWNGSSFVSIQALTLDQPHEFRAFTIGTDTYLAVNQQYNDVTRYLNTLVYKWNGSYFALVQSIASAGGYSVEPFNINGDNYLVIGNYIGNNYKVYKWSGSSFVLTQTIGASRPRFSEFFELLGESYLLTTNAYDLSAASYNVDSKLYKWNGTAFDEIASIPTNSADSFHYFTVGNKYYFIVSNKYNDSSYNINSHIYQIEWK